MKKNLNTVINDFYKKEYRNRVNKYSRIIGFENAEDCIQEALIKFAKTFDDGKGDAVPFMNTLIRQSIINFIRDSNRRNKICSFSDKDITAFKDFLSDGTDLEISYSNREFIEEIPEILKDWFFGMSDDELAEKYNLNINSIRETVYQAKKKARNLWTKR